MTTGLPTDSLASVVREMFALRGAPALRPGTVIGDDYQIERLIGEGGMGAVYRARDLRLDRAVAVKVHRGVDPGAVGRLSREAIALARLSHPNVVAVHRVGTHEGRAFVAMEYVEGGSLRDWLRTPRSWREIVAMFRAAGSGLAAAHRAGLVHRDIKPDNVLVGADGRPRVADFGLARAFASDPAAAPARTDAPPLDASGTETTIDARAITYEPGPPVTPASPSPSPSPSTPLTATGARVGTPAYMAPEQLDGRPVDARADQYAFCVSMWEALFGARPRPSPRPPRTTRVPRRIVAALRRGLAADPGARFADLDALVAALAPSRRRAIALGVVVAAIAAGTTFALTRGGDADERPPTPSVDFVAALSGAEDGQLQMAIPVDGDLVVVGHATDASRFLDRTMPSHGPESYAFVVRIDLAGHVRWLRPLVAERGARGLAIAARADGDLALSGKYSGRFDQLGLPATSAAGAGAAEGFVARMDASTGAIRWARAIGGSVTAAAQHVAVAGDMIVVGGNVEGDLLAGDRVTAASGTGASSGFLLAYDGGGALRWTYVSERGAWYRLQAFAARGDALFAVSYGDLGAHSRAHLLRIDARSGRVAWERVVDGGAERVVLNALAVARDGAVLIGGTFTHRLALAPGLELRSVGGTEGMLGALDPDTGAWRWARAFGGRQGDEIRQIVELPDGDLVTAARSFGSLFAGATTSTAHGGNDIVLARWTHDGRLLRATRIGGENSEVVRGLAALPDGRVAIAGNFQGVTRFGDTALEAEQRDGFVAVLAPP